MFQKILKPLLLISFISFLTACSGSKNHFNTQSSAITDNPNVTQYNMQETDIIFYAQTPRNIKQQQIKTATNIAYEEVKALLSSKNFMVVEAKLSTIDDYEPTPTPKNPKEIIEHIKQYSLTDYKIVTSYQIHTSIEDQGASQKTINVTFYISIIDHDNQKIIESFELSSLNEVKASCSRECILYEVQRNAHDAANELLVIMNESYQP